MNDTYNLERFIEAQESIYSGYADALGQMKEGRKRGHWIWYIFPQIQGLGHSGMCHIYGIHSKNEARAYLEHPVLGQRLREITNVVLSYPEDANPNVFMMQPVDAMKLKSCMTLFDIVSPGDIFGDVLNKFFGGQRCQFTKSKLAQD